MRRVPLAHGRQRTRTRVLFGVCVWGGGAHNRPPTAPSALSFARLEVAPLLRIPATWHPRSRCKPTFQGVRRGGAEGVCTGGWSGGGVAHGVMGGCSRGVAAPKWGEALPPGRHTRRSLI